MGGGGREGELPGGEATFGGFGETEGIAGHAQPFVGILSCPLLGALRGGANIIPILQRWELRLREVKALPKVTQLLYKLMNIPHPCLWPPPSPEVTVALALFSSTTLDLEKRFVLCDPLCGLVIISHQNMT